MKKRQRPMSAAIEALPETFDLDGLVDAARQLLRKRGAEDAISAQQIDLYIEQALVDPPATQAPAYRRRHLLQVVAIHSLRGIDLSMARIRQLVQGVDDGYLRMLCDEPIEAEKKAAVMSNWLKMLSNGRVGRPERGETQLLNAPSPAPAPPPEMHVAPMRNNRGVAPALEISPLDGPPDDLPTGHAPTDLPDGMPPTRQVQPRTRELRPPRPTFAASRSLADALRDQMETPSLSATPQVPLRVARARAAEQTEAPTAMAAAVPQAWTRLRLAEGVELHVQVGHEPLATEAIDTLVAQIRALLDA